MDIYSGEGKIILSKDSLINVGKKVQVTANGKTIELKAKDGTSETVKVTAKLLAKKSGTEYAELDTNNVVFEKEAGALNADEEQYVKWETSTPVTQASTYKGTTTFTVNGNVDAS